MQSNNGAGHHAHSITWESPNTQTRAQLPRFRYHAAMSLRAKIAIGVLAATAVLAVALAYLGLEAKGKLDQATDAQREQFEQRFKDFSDEQHRLAVKSLQDLVLGQLSKIINLPRSEISTELRDPQNGMKETAIIERLDNGTLEMQVLKPQGSRAELTDEERREAEAVFNSGQHRFFGDVLFHPYDPDGRPQLRYVLRLKLDIPPLKQPDLPRPASADLGPLVVAAFTTLALAMLAVFVMLMFALRKFVLEPLGNVLEDSERIVKGEGGLEVRGFKGGKDIETLVTAFNAMFSELKAYQSDLEGKVKSATRTIKQQQQSLVIAQRLAATGTLAAGLAHEVNNPLSGMLNAARRLKKREGLDERQKDYIELIEEGLQRIENLMKQILDFSRRRDMKPERFDPESAFRRALPLVRHRLEKKELRLEEDIQKELPQLYGNEEEIGQVVMNLLINAIDAAPEGGAVRITIREEGGGVAIAIDDSGSGVPDEIRGRIFDPFFTTKEPGKGTGLGLSIVHTIIDNHGGTIDVDRSELLGGARFTIKLPPASKRESTRQIEVA
jgi:signal transduction histidine kinase